MPAPKTSSFSKTLARPFARTLASGDKAASEYPPRPLIALRGPRSRTQHGVRILCIAVITAFIAACAPAEPAPNESTQTATVESPDTSEKSAGATEPETTEPATVEPTEAPTDNETLIPPVLPELAKEYSEEGAIAFMEYMIEVLNYSVNSGDHELFDSLTLSDCNYCNTFRTRVQALSEPDVNVTNFRVRGTDFYFGAQRDDLATVGLTLIHESYMAVEHGKKKNYPRSSLEAGTLIKWNSGWKVQELGVAE